MRKLLMVCTGNTCRSPMAEAIMRRALQENGIQDVQVLSAGVAAFPGSIPSAEALRVMAEQGLDIGSHRSRPLDQAMMDEADLVLTMTQGQCRQVKNVYPAYQGKVATMHAWATGQALDIDDPIGQSVAVYRQVALKMAFLAKQIAEKFKEGQG